MSDIHDSHNLCDLVSLYVVVTRILTPSAECALGKYTNDLPAGRQDDIPPDAPDTPSPDPEFNPLIVIVTCVALVVVVTILAGVLMSRKRARGKPWFPDGFLSAVVSRRSSSSARTSADDSSSCSRGSQQRSVACVDQLLVCKGAQTLLL